MAEAVFAHLVNEAGLSQKIHADSAGTGNWHVGASAHHGTLGILKQNAVPYNGRARQLSSSDLDEFDYIITMDDDNLANVLAVQEQYGGKAHVAPLLSYAPHLGEEEVPDPYFSGGFEGVYELVHAGSEGLLNSIRSEYGLWSC